ncbi:hypothetical protein TNCV_806591 [Trichonephila clavipes]|nr:hypothetical protein TNCV_806591 [Trichonephila clavipes]
MDVCTYGVLLRHRDTLNSRRAASPLMRLVEGEMNGAGLELMTRRPRVRLPWALSENAILVKLYDFNPLQLLVSLEPDRCNVKGQGHLKAWVKCAQGLGLDGGLTSSSTQSYNFLPIPEYVNSPFTQKASGVSYPKGNKRNQSFVVVVDIESQGMFFSVLSVDTTR